MSSRKITEPLTLKEWEHVMEYLYEAGAEGVSLAQGMERMREWGVVESDLARVPRMFQKYSRSRWRDGVEGPAALTDEMAELLPQCGSGRLPEGIMGILCEALETMFGAALTRSEVKWGPGPEVVMRPDDTYLEKTGEGPGWLVGAVIVRRKDGTEEVYPEHRVKGLRGKLRPGRRHPQLIMECLHLCVDALDEKALLRRLAAWKFTYFGRESGVSTGVELATVCGVKKQTLHKQLKRVRRVHEKWTGEGGTRLKGCVPERGRRTA